MSKQFSTDTSTQKLFFIALTKHFHRDGKRKNETYGHTTKKVHFTVDFCVGVDGFEPPTLCL